MTAPLVLAVDPGLDVCGVGWVGVDALRRPRLDVVGRCSLRTKPADALPVRLAALARQLRKTLRTVQPAAVVVEVPHFLGLARERAGRGGTNIAAKGLATYWQALGVVRCVAADSGLPVLEVPPGVTKKEARQLACAPFTKHGKNADERDALALAASYAAVALRDAVRLTG